ncbi:hypothetical protein LLEC1_07616 [Akanthomyces lecanii]|uniref:Uncharacterized protein n=1 Tax=Cordyceps confragosa TaxID=2714763 RepID=A0A179IA86_CORDF|nr:hypothetical protein LLEC1_07616 [Akanthomyces lecanii]
MSRNVRKKVTTPKRPKRRDSDTTSASSFDLSDDDGYSAVEDITDSEDDDEDDVDAVEEENIRTEATTEPLTSPRPPTDDGNEDEEDDDEAYDQDLEIEVDLSVDGNLELDDADEQTSWAGIVSDAEDNQLSDFYNDASAFASDTAVERHVHFDVPSSDSDSTDTEDDDHGDLFPDIFVSQNSLDPAFRREIENDPDDGSSDSGTFWDYSARQHDKNDDSDAEEIVRQFSDDETPIATPHKHIKSEDMTPTFTGVQDLDGYETDGDTTEDDTPEPPVRRKTRRPSVAISEMTDSESEPVKNQRGQPRLGRFKLDRTDKKPIAVLNPLTRKMMIFTPHRRHQLDLSPEQFNLPWPMEDPNASLMSNSANMMLSAMFSSNTFGDFVNPQTMGPAEAFFPFPTEAVAEASSSSIEGDDDDAEKNLDISDFITWDDGGSSGEEDENGNWQPSSTPLRPTTASSEIEVLSHLNPETVGAFRRNQINQQLILSNQATQDSLAFSGPYNYTAIKGLKSDRFDTAGIPLTPIRRHKKHMSDRSPLDNVSAKRKASGDHAANGHKRHRSISDVNMLRI